MTKEEKERYALELMREYGAIKALLNDYGICKTEREPTGDYAEWLVATKMGLQQANNPVQRGYDLEDHESGKTYQVKARRIIKSHPYKISISHYQKYHFDYLVILLFNEDFTVKKAYQYTYDSIPQFFSPKGDNKEIEFTIVNYREKLEKVENMQILSLK